MSKRHTRNRSAGRRSRTALACVPVVAMTLGLVAVAPAPASATPGQSFTQNSGVAGESLLSPADFAAPPIEYRPGVRWWWPGGAVDEDTLDRQLDYLYTHGFGTVEINPFGGASDEDPAVADVYSPAFYEKLESAIAKADELGITVDLNMGSGWNANGPWVDIEEAEGNAALGRSTVGGDVLKVGGVRVPALAKSEHYGDPMPRFDASKATLQGVLVAKRGEVIGAIEGDAAIFDDGETIWDERIALDNDSSWFVDADDVNDGSLTLPDDELERIDDEGEYEIVALYHLPAGTEPVDSARGDWFVVDHMSRLRTANYVNEWLADPAIASILDEHDNVRALFNDSYELGTDLYYTEDLYDLAGDAEHNGIGYDFRKYLPTVYRQNLRLPAYRGGTMAGASDPYVSLTRSEEETERILWDYRQLAGQKFAEGLAGFQEATNEHGLLFRQQAYNPPIDMIGAAQYVDIPEQEQHDEFRLRTAASGSHLYGRNVTTAEQFTLGFKPFTNSLDTLRTGIDMMATAGVNNFFYHGFNYDYGAGTETYGENGWAAFPTIGVHMSENNTLSGFFPDLNAYASRLNYVTQQGSPSTDVAVYAPFDTPAADDGSTPTLNSEGYTWDVINDASITNPETVWQDGRLSVNGGNIEYDALIVDTTTVPVATMERLLALAEAGTPIVFFGDLPNGQAGFADGGYEAEDEKVSALASELTAQSSVRHPEDASALAGVLAEIVDPELTYGTNDDVRMIRRTLDNGAELAFIRNIAPEPNVITVTAGEEFENFYWLDQEDGSIYPAEVVDGDVTLTLDAGNEILGRGDTEPRPSKGVILLAEPAGSEIAASALSEGLPAAVNRVAPESEISIVPRSLTVTADNLDGVIGGDVATESFTEDVLGNWKDADYQGGALRSVVSDGIYEAQVEVEDPGSARYVLNLGQVFTAATVEVNGESAGQLAWAPYQIDVTAQLVAGVNEIRIIVTPRKANRYFPAETNTNGRYSTDEPLDAGLVGPVSLQSWSDDETPEITIAASATPKAVDGEVVLDVAVTNEDEVPVDVTVDTPFDESDAVATFASDPVVVNPGATVTVTVYTGEAEIPAGEAVIEATAVIGDETVTATTTAPYEAFAVDGPDGPDDGDGDGSTDGTDGDDLAVTGGTVALGVLILAALLLASGFILVRHRRRVAGAGDDSTPELLA